MFVAKPATDRKLELYKNNHGISFPHKLSLTGGFPTRVPTKRLTSVSPRTMIKVARPEQDERASTGTSYLRTDEKQSTCSSWDCVSGLYLALGQDDFQFHNDIHTASAISLSHLPYLDAVVVIEGCTCIPAHQDVPHIRSSHRIPAQCLWQSKLWVTTV